MTRPLLTMFTLALFIPTLVIAADGPTTQPTKTQVEAQARTYQPVEDGPVLRYRIANPSITKDPDTDQPIKLPLVIALHGAGERGDDNAKQVKHFKGFYQGPLAEKYPAIVIMPQVPTGGRWTSFPADKDGHTPEGSPLALTRQLIDELGKDLNIDTDRIYVTGLSMGGYGTWMWMEHYPEITAAAVPICGGGNPDSVKKFKHVPVWAFHGERTPSSHRSGPK